MCSLFLACVSRPAASQAARDFDDVKYSRTGGVREYVQRLKMKARHLEQKPNESSMIVRFLVGLPSELSRRLTLREKLDPARHRFKHFVAKLCELEGADGLTEAVNVATIDDQRKMNTRVLCGLDRSKYDAGFPLHGPTPDRSQEQRSLAGQPNTNDQRRESPESPGDARICSRSEH